jgi:hypothetical protein
MNPAFLDLFGQIGATFIAIIFSFFVGYLLYIKEQRDKTGTEIIALKNRIISLFQDLHETPIPGVVQSLVSTAALTPGSNRLSSISSMTAGTSWSMRVRGAVTQTQIWDQARQSLEELVRGAVPPEMIGFPVVQIADSGYFTLKLEIISDTFRNGAKSFLKNTKDIDWFARDYAGYSWARTFIEKMREWESANPNPVLRSQDVATLFERILTLRRLVPQVMHLETNYENLKIGNFISHYKIVLLGMLTMFVSSVFAPMILLFTYPEMGMYQVTIGNYSLSFGIDSIAIISWVGFVISLFMVVIPLFRTAVKNN